MNSGTNGDYDFFWDNDIDSSSSKNTAINSHTSSSSGGARSSSSSSSGNADPNMNIDDAIVSRKTIVHTTTEEQVLSSDDQSAEIEQETGITIINDDEDDNDDDLGKQNAIAEEDVITEPTSVNEQPEQNATTAATSIATAAAYQRPTSWHLFPRWNATTGIHIQPLIEFIYGVAYDNATTIETKTIRNMFPETLYVFDVTGVYYSYNIRQRTLKTFINDRVKPTEMIMKLAHQILMQHIKGLQSLQQEYKKQFTGVSSVLLGGSSNNSNNTVMKASESFKVQRRKIHRMENKWKRLQAMVLEKGSFPFLAWYGDFTGCNFHNWKRPVPYHGTDTTRTTTTRRRLTATDRKSVV